MERWVVTAKGADFKAIGENTVSARYWQDSWSTGASGKTRPYGNIYMAARMICMRRSQ